MLLVKIAAFCKAREEEFGLISDERKSLLLELSNYISKNFSGGDVPKMTVICTHNSRRSHIGQLFLAVGAEYYKLPKVETYSGGTEATAFNPRAVRAMENIGFDISVEDTSLANPNYKIKWSSEQKAYPAFSKKYDRSPNPSNDFAAIIVCTSADEGCPIVAGCDFRLFLPFEDPKAFDDTDLEAEKYMERAHQIARELLFMYNQVAF